jgi:predicted HD phosphohydrolase
MENPTYPASATRIEDVLAILRADSGTGEPGATATMTTLDHHLQCADVLRASHPDDREMQVAGLLHDIGHRLAAGEPDRHGAAGAAYIRGLFGERVSNLVELHVDAKRYLVSVEPEYRSQLSAGSALTLIAQGEAMDAGEVAAFEAKLDAADAVVLRRADEAAKVPGRAVPPLEEWIPVLEAAMAVGR